MKSSIRAALLVAVVAICVFSAVDARADGFPTVAYRLVEGSTYQEGCFDPCDCPILMEQPMVGTFDLVFYPFAGPIWTVAVEHVEWAVPTLGKELSGQGLYRRPGDMQDLQFELQIDGDPARLFQSGLVAGGSAFPFVDATVSMNGLFCYDIALHVRAEPVLAAPHLTLDGTRLAWNVMPAVAVYDVIYGDLASLRTNGGDFGVAVDACLADDLPETTLIPDLPVDSGRAVWFLVRPQGGSYDSEGAGQFRPRDAEIANSGAGCP